jgi:succinate dehydrogenase/fumarate reductase cytochrome b subunit
MSPTAPRQGRAAFDHRRLTFAAPSLVALAYPFLLKAFNAAVTASGGGIDAIAAALLALVLLSPAVALWSAARLGALEHPGRGELLAKRIAILAFAAPPIFTLMGVLLYMAKGPLPDEAPWTVFWLLAFVASGLGLLARGTGSPMEAAPPSPKLRVVHGVTAAVLVLLFLAMHLTNHLSALWSLAAQKTLMADFRTIYRAPLVEPVIVALFLFQVATGSALLWAWSRGPADLFRTLQLCTGAYLIFYITGHMNSVFVFARAYLKIQTDWSFATGAPAGLIKDAWNIRLLPHYLFGVACVVTHLLLGARGVALAHGTSRATVDRVTVTGIGASLALATAIVFGMTGVHLAEGAIPLDGPLARLDRTTGLSPPLRGQGSDETEGTRQRSRMWAARSERPSSPALL